MRRNSDIYNVEQIQRDNLRETVSSSKNTVEAPV